MKNPFAVSLGSLGGKARGKKLSKKRKSEIAIEANRKRWAEHNKTKKAP